MYGGWNGRWFPSLTRMSETPVILFGLGFTSLRLARRLLASGRRIFAASRNPERFQELVGAGLSVVEFHADLFPRGAVVAHTIPPVAEAAQEILHRFLLELAPRRIVYVSATSVYGELESVSGGSPVIPSGEASLRRYAEENWVADGPWQALILRAAAIYGPGRGAHRRLAVPRAPALNQRRGPSGLVSRIHVDDLARLMERGLDSELCGAFPVADTLPCSTEAILQWCVEYLGLDPNQVDISGTISTGRRVDGADILNRLGVQLEYEDYRAGIAQCIREEGWGKVAERSGS